MKKPEDVIINGVTIAEILEKHKLWLKSPINSSPLGYRADLSNACIEGVDLRGANLEHSVLMHTSFRGCDLRDANLDYTTMYFTNFEHTSLTGSSLRYSSIKYTRAPWVEFIRADLEFASISYSSFSSSNLNGANLCGMSSIMTDWAYCLFHDAILTGSHFRKCNLISVNLSCAKLSEAEFDESAMDNAVFSNSDITKATFDKSSISTALFDNVTGELIDFRKGKVLREDIIGYKKCRFIHSTYDIYDRFGPGLLAIVTLLIPKGATVFSINGNKCRTNRAKVIAINDIMGAPLPRAQSCYKYMSYYVGDEFNMYDFDCAYNVECGRGIHFFMNKQDAIDY